MQVEIEVVPLTDDQDISFSDLQLFHSGCVTRRMLKHRNPATGTYIIRCECGLEIELTDDASAKYITYTAIDEQPRTLKAGTYKSSSAGPVVVKRREGRRSR